MHMFYYEVSVMDIDGKITIEYGGFTVGETYSAAMQNIEEMFRDDLVSVNKLIMYEDESIMIPVEASRKMREMYEDNII